MTRDAVTGARRVVVKVGSSSLTTAAGGIDPERISALVDSLAGAHGAGSEIVLVSSGAIAAGLAPLGLDRRPQDLARQQAAASVGQGILVHRYTEEFARHGKVTGQILLTVDDVTRRGHYRNAQRTFETLLDMGVVPVVNENDTVATDEIRFGDNDRLAALVAHLVQADLLVLLSDVDGLYDGPPSKAGARLVAEVHGEADLEQVIVGKAGAAGVGTGGMQTKLEAARIATGAGIAVVLTSAPQAGPALAGAEVGTLFHPTGARRSTRMLWLAHATSGRGTITLDEGAVRALTERRASLLPAGITGVEGTFVDGDPVDLVAPDGTVVARGLVNYDSAEIPALMGRSTHDLSRELGAHYEREVVHRDDLTLLAPTP
ncbi:MAG: glutamate 5-kinase [Propionibacteriales bacterium]|nr:glutamate 5-kinase [Propionibacteriales bacterium]